MKDEKILSISIAAYNVEKFIKETLDSFVESGLDDEIELIVVDDGSKDDTKKIVNEYLEKYPKMVKIISQKNSGHGSTINTGLRNATGKYFKIIDGDDWVKTENLTKYIKFLKNNDVDMVVTNYSLVDNDTYKETERNIENQKYNKIIEFNKVAKNLKLDMHNVTYRTDILKNNNIIFDNGFYVDVEYLLMPIPFIKKIAFLDIIIYMYRVSLSTQSTSNQSMQKNIQMHNIVLTNLIKFYENNKGKMKSESRYYIINRLSDMVYTQLRTLLSFKSGKKNETISFVNNVKEMSNEIYNAFAQKKMAKLLIKSNFSLYSVLSIAYRVKFKIK